MRVSLSFPSLISTLPVFFVLPVVVVYLPFIRQLPAYLNPLIAVSSASGHCIQTFQWISNLNYVKRLSISRRCIFYSQNYRLFSQVISKFTFRLVCEISDKSWEPRVSSDSLFYVELQIKVVTLGRITCTIIVSRFDVCGASEKLCWFSWSDFWFVRVSRALIIFNFSIKRNRSSCMTT